MVRRGYTLIEVLVGLAIIASLIALLIPAVLAARESARRARCLSNLRQIGLGLQGYAAREGVFPSAFMKSRVPWSCQGLSAFARFLPEMEEVAVFHSINFEANQNHLRIAGANQTASTAALGFMVCPADSAPGLDISGAANYRVNMGTSADSFPRLYEPSRAGASALEEWVRPGEFRDGLAATAMVSERLRGDGDPSAWKADRDYWFAGIDAPGHSTAAVVGACGRVPRGIPPHSSAGEWTWLLFSYTTTSYNHVVGPNPGTADCTSAPAESASRGGADAGVFPARSHHRGGAYAVLGDGSARWCGDGIALPVWHALGTRSGGDLGTE